MGLLERLSEDESNEDEDTRIAHDVLEKIEEGAKEIEERAKRHISSTRVIFASIAAVLLLATSLFVLTWLVPYDRVSVDVVYRQGGPGHVVLVELDNKGSRTIEDINLHIRFVDSNGIEVDRSIFNRDSLSAHTSVAGDDLELLVNGTSVWENYTIEILLNYEYYGGDRSERWTHDVGEWTMEIFVDKSPYRFL